MKWQISQIIYNLCPNSAKNTYRIKKKKKEKQLQLKNVRI